MASRFREIKEVGSSVDIRMKRTDLNDNGWKIGGMVDIDSGEYISREEAISRGLLTE